MQRGRGRAYISLLSLHRRHLEVDDTGGVYAQLQLPTWPQTSVRALKGFVKQYWSKASLLLFQKVCWHRMHPLCSGRSVNVRVIKMLGMQPPIIQAL